MEKFDYKYTFARNLQLLTNLAGFETKFDLHLAGLSPDPHVHLKGNKKENKT